MRRIGIYIAWGLVAAVCVLAFLLAGNPAALAIALAVIVLPAVGYVLVRVGSAGLSARLESPTTSPKGAPIGCRLVLGNPSPVPLLKVEARIDGLNMLTGQRFSQSVCASVPPRSSAEVDFSIRSELCGRVELRVSSITAYEPFGILGRRRPCGAERRLSVMPELNEMFMRDMMAAAPLSDTVTFSPYRKGQDASEVFALREYEPGDDIRNIHWKLSEKVDALVVREPSLPIDNSIMVLWDKNLYGTAPDPRRADALAELMLAVCEMLCSQGISFDVVFNDVASGRVVCENVGSEDDIYELVGSVMSTPLGNAGESAVEAYARLYGPLQSSRVICLACAQPEGLRDACRGKSLTLFVCDDAAEMATEPDYAEIHFAAGDLAGAIAMAEAV